MHILYVLFRLGMDKYFVKDRLLEIIIADPIEGFYGPDDFQACGIALSIDEIQRLINEIRVEQPLVANFVWGDVSFLMCSNAYTKVFVNHKGGFTEIYKQKTGNIGLRSNRKKPTKWRFPVNFKTLLAIIPVSIILIIMYGDIIKLLYQPFVKTNKYESRISTDSESPVILGQTNDPNYQEAIIIPADHPPMDSFNMYIYWLLSKQGDLVP